MVPLRGWGGERENYIYIFLKINLKKIYRKGKPAALHPASFGTLISHEHTFTLRNL